MERKLRRKLRSNEHVHHINGNKTDNRPENLELVSPGEHIRLHGLTTVQGEQHPASKLTVAQVREIRHSRKSQGQLARQFGIAQATVWAIIHKKTWRA